MKILMLFSISLLFLSLGTKADETTRPLKNEKGKWGIANASGNYIVKPEYTEIDFIGGDQYIVALGGKYKNGVLEGEKWGVIDSKGNVLLKNSFDNIGDFINGLASITLNGKTGFVNNKWEIIVEPKYDFTGTPNKQGFVWVNIGGKPDKQHNGLIKGGKYGIVNISGEIIVPAKYASIGTVSENKYRYDENSIYNASNDMERLMLECGSHHALWSKSIEQRPGSILPEAIGFSFSSKLNLTANGISSLNGEILLKENIYQRCAMPSDGMAMVITKQGKLGFHDIESNKLYINPAIQTAFSFENNITIGIGSKNQWNFYDKNLKQIGDTYNWISPRIDNLHLVKKGDLMYILNISNFNTLDTDMNFIFPPSEGYMVFKDNTSGLWGYLKDDGTVATEPQYIKAYSFNHGVACVKGNSGWGIIDTTMNKIIKPQWDGIVFPSDDAFNKIWVIKNLGHALSYHCISRDSGEKAFDATYTVGWNYVRFGDCEYAAVKIDNKYGYIDSDGTIVVPIEMSSKRMATRALGYKLKHSIDNWLPIHSYRFSIQENSNHNLYKLHDVLPDTVWDY